MVFGVQLEEIKNLCHCDPISNKYRWQVIQHEVLEQGLPSSLIISNSFLLFFPFVLSSFWWKSVFPIFFFFFTASVQEWRNGWFFLFYLSVNFETKLFVFFFSQLLYWLMWKWCYLKDWWPNLLIIIIVTLLL